MTDASVLLAQLAQCRDQLGVHVDAAKDARLRLSQSKRIVAVITASLDEIEDGFRLDVEIETVNPLSATKKFGNETSRKSEVRKRMRDHPEALRLRTELAEVETRINQAQLDLAAAEAEYKKTVDQITALTAEVKILTEIPALSPPPAREPMVATWSYRLPGANTRVTIAFPAERFVDVVAQIREWDRQLIHHLAE